MKHLYISVLIFSVIVITGLFSDKSTGKELEAIELSAARLENITDGIVAEKEIKVLKDRFYNKKNMLLLFISKEHIKDIEKEILIMEKSITSGDMEKITDSSITIQVLADYARCSLYAVS